MDMELTLMETLKLIIGDQFPTEIYSMENYLINQIYQSEITSYILK